MVYGNPEVTPGGRALKFYSSVRLDVRRVEQLKSGTEVVGNRTRVKVVKNKVAPPFREAEFDIMYGQGISKSGETLDLAVKLDIVNKSGAWFSYNGERLGQGRDNVKVYFEEHPELMAEIDEKIRENGDKLVAMRGAGKMKKSPVPVKTETVPPAGSAAPAKSASKEIKVDIEVDEDR